MDLLVLHGWGHTKKEWMNLESQLRGIQAIRSVHIIDLPGFGEEPLPPTNWGIPEYAEWVSLYIKRQKLSDVILLGHSFGGRIAAYLASQDPAYVKALILSGTPTIYSPSTSVKIKKLFSKTFKSVTPDIVKSQFYSDDLKVASTKGLGGILRNVVPFDQTSFLPRIKVPTLLIWGENDDSAPLQIAHKTNTLIPKSQLKVIKKAKHNTFVSHPYLFFGYVKEFIEQL